MPSSTHHVSVIAAACLVVALSGTAAAQNDAQPASRTAQIEQAQVEKSHSLRPFEPGKAERVFESVEESFLTGAIHLHPFFDSAYAGGGFTLGAGYATHVSSYNVLDVRGSYTIKSYTRLEAAFLAPRLFDRRGVLTAVGGWREATQVGFYGTGTHNTSVHDRTNYGFTEPYASATLDFWPTRKLFVIGGGVEVATRDQQSGEGSAPSVEEKYTEQTLPGLGASPTYLHTQASVGLDSRPSPGYARHGGLYNITFHDYRDSDSHFGFRQTDYEAIQHIPILRDTWVLSLHGRLELANAAGGQSIPFFMLPALGGGSSLRGFASWRFRDVNSLLMQAEWRVLVNRFVDLGFFYDTGRVATYRSDLTDGPLKSDYGFGFRFHGPLATPLRIELARSNEGTALVFSAKPPF
jgi:surface antigen Omp85-like protein